MLSVKWVPEKCDESQEKLVHAPVASVENFMQAPMILSSGVAMQDFGHETKRKEFKGDTQKYYEIHAINSGKNIGLYIFSR